MSDTYPNTLLSADIASLSASLSAQMLTLPGAGSLKFNVSDIEQWLQAYAQVSNARPLSLPFVRPDFEGIKQQLQSKLNDLPSWRTLIQAGVGETILEFVATIGAYGQQANMRSLQEAFPSSARLTSSIYSVTRLLGVHIGRKQPASVSATITYNNFSTDPTVLIPRYSQFNVNGVPYFNRDPIVINTSQPSATVTLYQGLINIFSAVSNGLPFQRFEIGNADFGVSDSDIAIFDDAYTQYVEGVGGIWNAADNDLVYFQNTTPNGNVEIQFGNGVYGVSPALNKTLNIVYATTLGSVGNSTSTGMIVTLQSLNSVVPDAVRSTSQSATAALVNRIVAGISGNTLTSPDSGGDEQSQDFYRVLAPHLYAAGDSIVTRQNYNSVPLTYSGLIDVYFQGQRELGRGNRNLINCVGASPLKADGTTMTDAEFQAFVVWLDARGIGKAEYIHIRPTAVQMPVVATIYCEQNTDLIKTQSFAEYLLASNYGVRRGILGYSTYRSDIDAILRIRQFQMQVDYLTLEQPTNDLVVDRTNFVQLVAPQLTMKYSNRTFTSLVGTGPQTSLPT